MILPDNAVIPSYLSVAPRGESPGSDALLENYVLRYGEVREIVYPDNSASQSKQFVEYTVEVQHRNGVGVSTSTLYRGVTAVSLFGGVSDRIDISYRAATKTNADGTGNGSKVLLLCISGDQNKALILGGVSVPQTKTTQSDGHYIEFEFNGAFFEVNKDGEVTFQRLGPTDNDGKHTESDDTTHAKIVFNKNGDIEFVGPKDVQFFKLINDSKAQLEAKALETHTTGKTSISADDNVEVQSSKKMTINATDAVHVGAATDKWVKGTTYRQAENVMNKSLAASMQSLSAQFATTSALVSTAATLGATPTVGGILALPIWMSVVSQLAGIGVNFGSMAATINAMEGSAETYLSRNYTD